MNTKGVWRALDGGHGLPSNRRSRWRGSHRVTRVMLVSAISCCRRYIPLGNTLNGAK